MTPSTQPVRVRFAPSPTGPLHVGNASMVLFNYVFAKSTGGKFILRIEDTDRLRSKQEYEEAIMRELKWLGLQWDEGPDIGGPFAPYRQSERFHIYKQYAQELLAKKAAYRCFCSPDLLARIRQKQQAAKQPTPYDRRCRRLSDDESESRAKAGEPHVVRLAAPLEGETAFCDVLRGKVTFRNDHIDDQVLLKTDGFPTYHLANVVDDHLMQITHVIRAEEWLSSTPKHVLLYHAFGWEMPVFVHMPILRNPKGGKLKKREAEGVFTIENFRTQGYLPEAMTNFLGLMGHSIDSDTEIFDLQTMIDHFSLDRLNTTAPVFDTQKLEWLNGEYIRRLSVEELAARVREGYTIHADDAPEHFNAIVALVQERLKTLGEFDERTAFFFEDLPYSPDDLIPKKKDRESTRALLAQALERFRNLTDWSCSSMEDMMRAFCEETDWKTRDLFMALRVAITGRTVSTPLFETMQILGRETSLRRLEEAVAKLET